MAGSEAVLGAARSGAALPAAARPWLPMQCPLAFHLEEQRPVCSETKLMRLIQPVSMFKDYENVGERTSACRY